MLPNYLDARNLVNSSPDPDLLLAIIGLGLAVFLVLVSIIGCLLCKIYQLESRDSGNQHLISTVENGNSREPESKRDDNKNETLLSAESLKLNQHFCINNSLIANLGLLEKSKTSCFQKGKLIVSGKLLDVMIKKALDPNDRRQHNLIEQELKVLYEKRSSLHPRSGFFESLKNPNILRFLGFTDENGVLSVISEYPEGGNLLQYIRNFRNNSRFVESVGNRLNTINDFNLLSLVDLYFFALQLARGMRYLSNASLYHRQLSLQNVFITKNKTIRIGNFSLARTGQNDQVYKGVTSWEMSMTHRAPETFDEKNYTDRSDVWSLGVCYYEFFSLGNTPYEKEVNGDMTEKEYLEFVRSGGRLEKPEYCGSEIYAQMKKCWLSEPFSRPTFGHYVEFFEDHFKKMDVQILKQMNAKLEEAYNYQQSLEDSIGRSSENGNFDVEYNNLPVL